MLSSAAAFLNTWDPVPLTLPAYSPLSLLLTASCRFITIITHNHRKQPQTNKSIFVISLKIVVSLSLTASSSTNLNRSRTTNPSGQKTLEEILVVALADSNFKPSPTLLPKSSLTDLSSDFATAVAWETRKPLVMERVKVAPLKAMEIRIKATEGARIFGAPVSIGVESVDLKPKRFDEAKKNIETSTSAEALDKTNCR
ncbi:hypothetical protein ACFX2I_033066 [Malus domestica]